MACIPSVLHLMLLYFYYTVAHSYSSLDSIKTRLAFLMHALFLFFQSKTSFSNNLGTYSFKENDIRGKDHCLVTCFIFKRK